MIFHQVIDGKERKCLDLVIVVDEDRTFAITNDDLTNSEFGIKILEELIIDDEGRLRIEDRDMCDVRYGIDILTFDILDLTTHSKERKIIEDVSVLMFDAPSIEHVSKESVVKFGEIDTANGSSFTSVLFVDQMLKGRNLRYKIISEQGNYTNTPYIMFHKAIDDLKYKKED